MFGGVTTATKAQLGVQSGSAASTSAGTATITFDTAFTTAPVVVVSPVAVSVGTNFVSVATTTNFVWTCGANGVTFNWVAVGPP